MRILFLTQILPYPLDAGPKTRAYYVLRHLAAAHDVTLVSFTRDSDSQDAVQHLSELCEDVICVPMKRSSVKDAQFLLQSLITGRPFLIVRDGSSEMWSQLLRVVDELGPFDAIHADQLWMASYALKVRKASQNGHRPIAVLDQHNAVYLIPQRLADSEHNLFKRILLAQESRKLASYEVRVCRDLDHVVWVTQEDYRAVQSQAEEPVDNSGVIPICVDANPSSVIRRKSGARRVTFLGGLHYPPKCRGDLLVCGKCISDAY